MYSHYTPRLRTLKLDRTERLRIAKEAKVAGFDSGKLWRFKDGDTKAETQAKADCQKYADEWEKKLNIGIEVCLGFML
jgi:hypothetical protein